jgi:hypothetical protein
MFLNPVYPEWFLLCHRNRANVTKSNVSAQDIFGAAREKEMREVKKRAEECRGGVPRMMSTADLNRESTVTHNLNILFTQTYGLGTFHFAKHDICSFSWFSGLVNMSMASDEPLFFESASTFILELLSQISK